MKRKVIIGVVLIVIILVIVSGTKSENEYYEKTKWGMSYEEVLSNQKISETDVTHLEKSLLGNEYVSVEGEEGEDIEYVFKNNKLTGVLIEFDKIELDLEKKIEEFEKLYGKYKKSGDMLYVWELEVTTVTILTLTNSFSICYGEKENQEY